MSVSSPRAPRMALEISGEGIGIHDIVDVAVHAEASGFDSVWHAENQRELWVPLAAIAAATSRIRVGAGVGIYARPPMLTEHAAANLDELSGGRHVLGLGAAPSFWNEHWHGLDPSRPVQRMREYIEVVRRMWTAHSGSRVTFEGERLRVVDYQRANSPLRERIPVYLGGTQRSMLRLAGEVADGVLYNTLTTPALLEASAQPHVEEGLERSGRTLDDIERGCVILTAVDEDRGVALDLARTQVAYYTQFPYFEEVLELHGLSEDARGVQEASQRGDLDGMVAAVTDRMLERLALVGTPEQVRAQLRDWSPYVTTPMLFSPTWRLTREQILGNYRAIIATFSAEAGASDASGDGPA